nr:AMP-binding protein [Propionicimonas sp.]
MRLRLLTGTDLVGGLADALAGGPPVAPGPEARLLPALGLDEPVEPGTAAVVTTSGSTGEPKAVVLGANAVRFAATAAHHRLGGPGEWVCALPTQHVAGLMTIARAVVAGTRVRCARSDLADLPEPDGRTYLSLVAAQLDRALADARLRAVLPDYAAILVGGSAVPVGLRDRAREAGIRVVTTYGMSETCGGCVYDGVPLDGVRVEIEAENEADPGVGRLSLGGPMAFSGYRLRPDLTREVLSGDLVRTNDRGRWLDGRLQVLGRIDDVVISGGAKVDLGAAQRACDEEFGPGVLALLAVPDERWGHRLVAVTTGDHDLTEVRNRLEPRLGRAVAPRELRRAATLAYTSIGKIDRTALLRCWHEKGEDGVTG